MKKLFPVMLCLPLLVALPAAADGLRFLQNSKQVPAACEVLGEVKAEAGGPWWTIVMSDAHIKRKVRADLIKAARGKGADTLALTAHRAYKRPDGAAGLERAEETGLAYRCPEQ